MDKHSKQEKMYRIKVRPVLVESKEPTSVYFNKDNTLFSNELLQQYSPDYLGYDPKQLNLISLEDEDIKVGDLCYRWNGFCDVLVADESLIEAQEDGLRLTKVVATQDQLSPELIQQLIDEYSLLGILRDFEIEMEYTLGNEEDKNQNLIPVLIPKLTSGFITVVVEKERGITVTRVEEETEYPYNLLCNMQYYMEYCQENGYVTPQEWLSKFKHYTDRKEPILYTEEEVFLLCRGAYFKGRNDESNNFKTHINECRVEIEEWFNQNKKK